MSLHQWTGESIDKMSIFGVSIAKIMELVKAEKENRLMILPCKIGTKIYRIVPDHSIIYPDPPEYKVIWDTFKLSDVNAFGKTVFLSEEEANTVKNK